MIVKNETPAAGGTANGGAKSVQLGGKNKSHIITSERAEQAPWVAAKVRARFGLTNAHARLVAELAYAVGAA
ncbi:hypothetical protein [Asticcacaulis sp. YBE204]|uniref:hypothetical protein n=1 Tax=Asticcacaulis sp. YBE204 TaxID=1282363 RepID=UPI0012DF1930|nr:hypothetical protein [Asticcacaulis sp. YBE204]